MGAPMAEKEWAYMNDAKMLHRRRIWDAAFSFAARRPEDSRVALMPGKNGMEIGVVRSMGVPSEKIHLIDKNAAVVATHRKSLPELGGTYGVTVARAFERMSQQGTGLDVAHLDYCSPLCSDVVSELKHVSRSRVIRGGGVLLVTLQRGRGRWPEDHWVKESIEKAEAIDRVVNEFGRQVDLYRGWDGGIPGYEPTLRDSYRAHLIEYLMARAINPRLDRNTWGLLRYGAYKSGARNLTMWWGLFRFQGGRSPQDIPRRTDGFWEAVRSRRWGHAHWFNGPVTPEQLRSHYRVVESWQEIKGDAESLLELDYRRAGHLNTAVRKISWCGRLDSIWDFLSLDESERQDLPHVGQKTCKWLTTALRELQAVNGNSGSAL